MAHGAAAGEIDRSADPEAVTRVFDRLAGSGRATSARVLEDERLRSALIAVAAASPALARLCVADESAVEVLGDLSRPVDLEAVSGEEGRHLARAKRLETLRIAARDLLHLDGLEEVTSNLSSLAGRLLAIAYRAATPPGGGLAVVGMGKLGGLELNYASDVDVLLVAPDESNPSPSGSRPFLELARTAWLVDLDLRPEGRAGPLVRTLASYLAYWDRWAHTWEFQALLKARAVAGDAVLGASFEREASARIWGRPFGAEEVADVRRMKALAEEVVSRKGLQTREIKRGRGGIRDIEFAVQLLELVHGRADPGQRSPSTLQALRALAGGGYVAGDDAASLEEAYRFLRTVEHRLQLFEDQPVHSVPAAKEPMTRLARVLGYRDGRSGTALGSFELDLTRHRATVRAIHERLFFRPLLEAFTSRGSHRAPTITAGAVADRLRAFGFTDTERAHQAVRELTGGFSRVSRMMQQVLPVLLDWLSESASPDLGLLGLRNLAGGQRSRDQLIALCRESPEAASQLCALLGTGPRFGRDFMRHPELLGDMAAGRFLRPASRLQLEEQAARYLGWRSGGSSPERGIGPFFRAEALRIACLDVLGLAGVDETGVALSDLAETLIGEALRIVDPPLPFAVVAMGRLGGREMGYSSDIDLLFVYDGGDPGRGTQPGAAAAAEASATSLVRILAGPTPATGPYVVDTALRPEGRQGPLARSVEAYALYYRRWAQVWERQALLRGRIVAGDEALGNRLASIATEFVWGGPFGQEEIREIRRTKARMERERVPASEDPKFHLKLGPGSLSDVEWTAQLLQLQHGVRTCGTLAALSALREVGALSRGDADTLTDSYRFYERARNRLSLVRDVPGDSLPTTGPALTALSRSLGTSATSLREEYRRHARRTRLVVERLFYGR